MQTIKNLTFLLFFALVSGQLMAQNPGCDGTRYKSNVFTTVKKTTVSYGPTTDQLNQPVNLTMDVYEPEGDNISLRPVVVLAHGGSFMFGAKTDMKAYCEALAKQGYVAATIDYRLYPIFILGIPDSLGIFDTATKAIGDLKAAVRYFREDAATVNQFKADGNNIFIGGYSAGAVAAVTATYLDANDDIPTFLQTILAANGGLEGISGTASNKTYSSKSKAVLSMSGGIYRSAWVDSTESPIQSIHGTADGTVNYDFGLAANIAFLDGSKRIHARANAVGLWNDLVTVPGGGHTDIYSSANFKPYVDTFLLKSVTLMESLACQASSNVEIVPEMDWSIAPNPSSNTSIRVELPQNMPQAEIRIVDSNGRLLLQKTQQNNSDMLDVSAIPAGNYWIVIQELSGKRVGGKLWVKL